MHDFLRKPKHGEVKDGECFTDIVNGKVIAQKAKRINGETVCLQVTKSVVNKDGSEKKDKDRRKIVESAKREVEALYKTKVETKKKSTRTKSTKKPASTKKGSRTSKTSKTKTK